jgi:RNA polymerase sigma-70 factor, ECF subfamily
MTVEEHVTAAFERHRRFVWGLGYRLTGSVFDADEVVQETFLRALEKGPRGDPGTWRPWLARVATNVGIDAL